MALTQHLAATTVTVLIQALGLTTMMSRPALLPMVVMVVTAAMVLNLPTQVRMVTKLIQVLLLQITATADPSQPDQLRGIQRIRMSHLVHFHHAQRLASSMIQ